MRHANAPLALLAAVVAGLFAAPVAAQYQEGPPFVAGDGQGWQIYASDVAVGGGDGAIVAFWQQTLDSHQGSVKPQALVASRLPVPGAAGQQVTVLETTETVTHPRVTSIAGGYLVAWTRGGGELRATVLDPAITPRRADVAISDNDGQRGLGRGAAVTGIAVGAALVWSEFGFGETEVRARLVDAGGEPRGTSFLVDDDVPRLNPFLDVAPLQDGGFVVAIGANADDPVKSHARSYFANGQARGASFELSTETHVRAIAASPDGASIVMVGVRSPDASRGHDLWARRFTIDGVALGPEFLVHDARYDVDLAPSVEFDLAGNLYVVWTERYPVATRARGYDGNGVAIGPAIALAGVNGPEIRTARLPSGSFVNAWSYHASPTVEANVVSLCTPGTSLCGDGVVEPLCERCDDGVANSDSAPDACRTSCRPAGCGDGVIDGGESCDDGNRDDCDGCDARCTVEAGIGCGDGVAYPACGELCDDANLVVGDGCSPGCLLERIPGGGSPASDCNAEWSIDNAANVPLLVNGQFSRTQTCSEGDPRCDFDGDPTRCTFHLKTCVNNTGAAACTPGTRLSSWTLHRPSAAQAAKSPALAEVRAALAAVVPAAIVGPGTRDLCTETVAVPVALRGSAARLRPGRLGLKTVATLYDGTKDTDGLKLVCLPAAP